MQLRGWFLFARNYFKYPKMLGWIMPSSPFLIDEVLKRVEWDKAKLIVEYGPGVGTFTKEILQRMRPDAMLLALETNDEFVQFLRESISDSRLCIVHRSAEHIDRVMGQLNLPAADYVFRACRSS